MGRRSIEKRQGECWKVRRGGARKEGLKTSTQNPRGREAKGQREGHLAPGEAG